MKRHIALLIAVPTALVIVGALLWATILQAQTMATQAQANAAQSTANLVGQCLTGLVTLIALAAGVGLGRGWSKLEGRRHGRSERNWLPGPNARWQKRQPDIQQPIGYLPVPPHASQPQTGYPMPIAQKPQVYLLTETADEEDVEDVLFADGWGL